MLNIAGTILAAEVAGERGEHTERIRLLTAAVEMEDSLPYFEPPYWYYPVRQSLGAALLEVGQVAEAEAVYREDLVKNSENGWSLYGLVESLRAQGKVEEAEAVEARLENAWEHADVTPVSSRY